MEDDDRFFGMTSQERWDLEQQNIDEPFGCKHCNKRPASMGYKTCKKCRDFMREYQANRR